MGKERAMTTRRRFKQSAPLHQRLALEIARLRKEAQGTPPGVKRDHLLRRVRQMESASRINEWLSSPGLQAPS
jgi:hypothetical protein